MPTLPAVSKVVRVDFFSQFLGDLNVRNRLFFAYTGAGPSNADMTTFLTTVGTAWGTNIAPLIQTNTTLVNLVGTDLTSPTAAQQQLGQSRAGTRAGVANGMAVAAIVRLGIGRRYRGGHPRVYLAGTSNADITAQGAWSSGYTALIQTNFAAFIAACVLSPPTNFGTITHANVSYFSGFVNKTFFGGRMHPVPVLRSPPLVDAVLRYTANPKPGSQRRRNLQSP